MNSKKKNGLYELKGIFRTVVGLDDPEDSSEVKELLRKYAENIIDDEIVADTLLVSLTPIKKISDIPYGWDREGLPYTVDDFDFNGDLITVEDYLDLPRIPLRNCPFCGHEITTRNHLKSYHDDSNGATMYSIKCSGCGVGLTGTSQMSVIIRWNRRDSISED